MPLIIRDLVTLSTTSAMLSDWVAKGDCRAVQWFVEFAGQRVPLSVLWSNPEFVAIVEPLKNTVEQAFATADPDELADLKVIDFVEHDDAGAS
jgi:hypothetical protein